MSDRIFSNSLALRTSQSYYFDESSADIHFIFAADDGSEIGIPAHKIFLAAGSEVFFRMFYVDTAEARNIPITNASYEAFKEFLQFFYFVKAKLTLDNISEVMCLANRYAVLDIDLCDKFVVENSPLENVWTDLRLAAQYERKELQQILIQKICNNSDTVFVPSSSVQCTQQKTRKQLVEQLLLLRIENHFWIPE